MRHNELYFVMIMYIIYFILLRYLRLPLTWYRLHISKFLPLFWQIATSRHTYQRQHSVIWTFNFRPKSSIWGCDRIVIYFSSCIFRNVLKIANLIISPKNKKIKKQKSNWHMRGWFRWPWSSLAPITSA